MWADDAINMQPVFDTGASRIIGAAWSFSPPAGQTGISIEPGASGDFGIAINDPGANVMQLALGTSNTESFLKATGTNSVLSLYRGGVKMLGLDTTLNINAFNSALTGVASFALINTSTVSGDQMRSLVTCGGTSLQIYATNVNETGTIVTGGPTGAQGVIKLIGAQPLVFGTNNKIAMEISGAQAISGWGVTATAMLDMSPDSGTFTGTLTGMTAATTGTVSWRKDGSRVTLYLTVSISGTSNTTAMTMTGVPAVIRPPTVSQHVLCVAVDAGDVVSCDVQTGTAGTLTFLVGNTVALTGTNLQFVSTGFNASGVKGLPGGWTLSYSLV
jgi:hypothetical protein